MSHAGIDILGWAATAVFVGSYFFSRPALLRGMQMLGALLWLIYGVLIQASPVIVANVLVFSAAAWTIFRGGLADTRGSPET
ncbi:MAG: YgjV family protein [Steroidobacterales bacterium]